MKHKLLTLFVALTIATTLFASNTQVDGIWYDFDNTNLTASVTYRGNLYYEYKSEYTGSVVVPETVTYNSTTYSVTTIGDWAFYECSSLTSITIPNSVTSIGFWAFYYCSSLTSVTIPNSVTTIGSRAFYGCSGLTSIEVDAANTHYCSIDGVLFNYAKDTLIQYPAANTRTEYTIPNSVTTIGSGAFSGCSGLTSVTIPNSVTTIGSGAFFGCSGLTSITIPNSVTTIGSSAFTGCSGLTSPVFNVNCFAYMPTSYKGAYTIPDGIKQIVGYAFFGCSGLTSVTIPNSVTTIEEYAFYGCSSLPVENNLRYADTYLVEAVDRTLSSYTIKEGTKWIGNSAFSSCSGLTSITIPNSVTTIGFAAFYKCSSLTSVTIPNSVIWIGDEAFYDCSGLNSIKCYAVVPPSIDKNTFYGVRKAIPLYVPKGSITWYQGDTYWKEFLNMQGMDDTAIETIKKNSDSARLKFIINNSLNILHNGNLFTATGARVK